MSSAVNAVSPPSVAEAVQPTPRRFWWLTRIAIAGVILTAGWGVFWWRFSVAAAGELAAAQAEMDATLAPFLAELAERTPVPEGEDALPPLREAAERWAAPAEGTAAIDGTPSHRCGAPANGRSDLGGWRRGYCGTGAGGPRPWAGGLGGSVGTRITSSRCRRRSITSIAWPRSCSRWPIGGRSGGRSRRHSHSFAMRSSWGVWAGNHARCSGHALDVGLTMAAAEILSRIAADRRVWEAAVGRGSADVPGGAAGVPEQVVRDGSLARRSARSVSRGSI